MIQFFTRFPASGKFNNIVTDFRGCFFPSYFFAFHLEWKPFFFNFWKVYRRRSNEADVFFFFNLFIKIAGFGLYSKSVYSDEKWKNLQSFWGLRMFYHPPTLIKVDIHLRLIVEFSKWKRVLLKRKSSGRGFNLFILFILCKKGVGVYSISCFKFSINFYLVSQIKLIVRYPNS